MKKISFFLVAGLLLFTGCSSKQSKLIYIPATDGVDVNRSDSLYEISRKEELARLIQEPVVPIKTQDKILRVLMLPYVDKNNLLQTSSFMFVKVEEGKWIVGDYLDQGGNTAPKMLTPLK